HAGLAPRIWRSTDGTTWTLIQPATFSLNTVRVAIGLVPSNPQAAFFFLSGTTTSPAVNGHQLYKYTYVSGDGSGAGGIWSNRSGHLPGDISTQRGYDMWVHVNPDDETFVLLGGTTLYRSTSGFATYGVTVIGGYGFSPGLTHHPDLPSGGFSPADPDVYYS